MTYDISVVVLTLNRCDLLKDTLASLVLQTLPPERYEILVIDNGSTDGTENLEHETGCWNANLRYICEPIPSCSVARNTGWQAAQAEIVAFIDDDAVAAADWLEKLLQGFQMEESTVACVGGRVQLVFPSRGPDWLPSELGGYLSGLHISRKPVRVTTGPIAANMAVRREALEAMGGFDSRLGRRPGTLLSREETCLVRQLVQQSHTCMYLPDAVVWHQVFPSRMKKGWFQSRLYWEGVALGIEDRICRDPRGNGQTVQLLRSLGRLIWPLWRSLALLRGTRSPRAFKARCEFLRDIGYVRGTLRDVPIPPT